MAKHDTAPQPDDEVVVTTRTRLRRRARMQKKRARAEGMLDGILSQLGPGDVALDCGANVGAVAVPLSETGATVYAFEPDPVAFAVLSQRAAGRPNLHAVAAAVGTNAGTATLHRTPGFATDAVAATVSSTLLTGVRAAETGDAPSVEVEVLDLPDIVADLQAGRFPDGLPRPKGRRKPGRLAVLKLDVEGAELDLLEALHAKGLLDAIGTTVAETHERKFPALRPRFAALRRDIAAAHPPHRVYLDWV